MSYTWTTLREYDLIQHLICFCRYLFDHFTNKTARFQGSILERRRVCLFACTFLVFVSPVDTICLVKHNVASRRRPARHELPLPA